LLVFLALYLTVIDSPAFQLVCTVEILNETSLEGTNVSFCASIELAIRKKLRPTGRKRFNDLTFVPL